jgi:hypothetical protein
MTVYTYKDITYSLKRSDRETVSIYVERDGSVSVLAPEQIEINQLNEVLEHKRYWIHKSLSELDELNRTRVEREFVNGEGFLYLGRSYRLKIRKNLKTPLSLYQGYFFLDRDYVEKARNLFIDFYKEKGKKHIPARVEWFKDRLGAKPEVIRVMELGNRWASRSDNNLNFHWRIVLAPLTLIDYVVVHELAHLIRPDHSQEFWSIVESVIPNYLERKNWLRVNGASLDI